MYCENCGRHAETRQVSFYYNIGVLIMRFSNTAEGMLCKSCIHHFFWKYTAISFFFGWWGIISFFVNWFSLINNVVQYLGALGMAAPPADSGAGYSQGGYPGGDPYGGQQHPGQYPHDGGYPPDQYR
jgi:hypothetical protein